MAYIGSSPIEKGTGLFSQDTFTGDGSTTAFDLTNVAPDGGGNDIQVFVDNVRQQEGASNAYTLGQDGNGDFKRITFTTAPAASQSIFVLNPGTKNVQQIAIASDNSITTAKIVADAVTEAKIADDSISEEHLDNTAITGHTELSATAEDNDVLLVFDTSASALKKIQKSNIAVAVPTFSSVSPTSLTSGDGTGNYTIVVTGTKFDASATFKLRTDGGSDIAMDTVTRNSATQLTGVVAKNTSGITNANEPFDVVVTNGTGLQVVATNQINLDASPVYTTAAGTLGTVTGGSAISTIDIVASDPESAGNVTFEFQSGSLPGGLSSATVNENGVSKFRITGTPTNPVANTTTNFVLRAVDAASNTTSRAFSITVNRTFTSQTFTSSGTFSVPSGVTSLDAVLVVAGGGGGGCAGPGGGSRRSGGGGAGGLIFMPGYPVTPGGTIAVTVGCGAAGRTGKAGQTGADGQDSVFAGSPSPGIGQGGVLTAKGGGGGGAACGGAASGNNGGSGGGGGLASAGPTVGSGGSKSQPTQPGNSGAYGFGNNGAAGRSQGAGGGGGAGASGDCGANTSPYSPGNGGRGGIGKAYTIADGTTSVYYAGGGGGNQVETNAGGQGGQGGGSPASHSDANPNYPGSPDGDVSGAANKGGGGGGTSEPSNSVAGGGGKGVVIVRY
tara:strand:- start:721 stop:2733 length:2013 start_codon:yes stop_codon:yes gene_type:complete